MRQVTLRYTTEIDAEGATLRYLVPMSVAPRYDGSRALGGGAAVFPYVAAPVTISGARGGRQARRAVQRARM